MSANALNPLSALTGITIQPLQPRQEHGQETTRDDPAGKNTGLRLDDTDKRELIELVRKYRNSWFLQRRAILRRVLKAHEFFKGNHFISFDPDSFQWFDAFESAKAQGKATSEDLSMYQFATNFYQMLGFAFIAALSSQTPKSRFLPDNAEREQDIATARASSTAQEIIERKNKIKSLHKRALLELWLSGCYFRHTRYVVDEHKAGTHKEPVVNVSSHEFLPARYVCMACGTSTPEAKLKTQRQKTCQKCGAPLFDESYYPAESAEMPVAQQFKDVPNGMVMMDIYGPTHVDSDPKAVSLAQTPIHNVDVEISVAALRSMYPEQWEKLRGSAGGSTAHANEEKQGRTLLYSETGSRASYMMDQAPTLSRTWIQPFAFNDFDDRARADKFKKLFPKGCLLVNVGDLFLEARPAELLKEWTWCGTTDKYGLFPPGVGDSAISLQERINDSCRYIHDYMDRLAGGITILNESVISSKSLNGKSIKPGTITGLRMKPGQTAPLRDQIVQLKLELDQNIYSYTDKLIFWQQLLVGVPAQIYGGSGDPHIETASGQQQQLQTAMGKLTLFWDNSREENAQAAELAINCAKQNMTDDWFDVVTDTTKQFRNQYVYMDEMQGSVHAYPETDQGFPMTHAEIQAFWEKLLEFGNSGKNPYVNAIMDEPANQQQIATWTGVPGLVVPGRALDEMVLQILDRLTEESPRPFQDAQSAGTGFRPSIEPDPELFNGQWERAVKTISEYLQKKWEMADSDPPHWENLKAFLKLCVAFRDQDQQKQAAQQQMAGKPPILTPR